MLLTHESPRTRWITLGAVWLFIASMVVVHSLAVKDYIALLDGVGRRGATELRTPLQRPIPTVYADAQTWVRHSLALMETDAWRIRYTHIDNAPYGREVHWSNGFAWLIAIEGWLRHKFTGEPLPIATERALAWFNFPLLMAVIVLFSSWVARRAGLGAGLLVALGMFGNNELYSSFEPNFADHHGLLAVANFGVILGVMFMGAGWLRGRAERASAFLPGDYGAARSAAIFSALLGAFGMWVSAASVVPAMAIAGGAAFAGVCLFGQSMREQGAEFRPGLWRLWGTVGAIATLAFYLLEYAPNHIALRMEVNHPLYALAWWAGGEIVAQACEWRLGLAPLRPRRLGVAFLAALSPLIVIIIGGPKVFIIRDPMILQLSARVLEGLSVMKAIKIIGFDIVWLHAPWALASLVPAAVLLIWARGAAGMLLLFAVLSCLAFIALGFFQIRFFLNTGGPEIIAILAALMVATHRWRPGLRWAVLIGVTLVLGLPERFYRLNAARATSAQHRVSKLDALQPLYRDIAGVIRASQPEGDIVLLTNPDASTAVGYYGRFKTIGTLYWENLAGVKAAAAMSSATSFEDARRMLAERGVTHVAVISESSFVPEYFELSHPGAQPDEWRQGFAFRLFAKENLPAWLEEVPYTPPTDIPIPDLRVVIFRTRLLPPAAEAELRAARAHVVAQENAAAEQAVDRGLALYRSSPDLWILKTDLALSRNDFATAENAAQQTAMNTPLARRANVATAFANACYTRGAHALAAKWYRASLQLGYDANTAANLAWLLATSHDDSVRDGAAALPLAEKVANENAQSYQALSVYAAALAENGRLPEAVEMATRALALARAGSDPNLVTNGEARLARYQSGQPWRQ